MNPPDGRMLRGFLADGDTGAGLAGLRVELWGPNGNGPALIAATRSDEAGVFRVRLPSSEPDSQAMCTDILVRPAKAGAFSGKQARQGKSQRPCNLDGREERNRRPEAHRQSRHKDGE